MTANRYERTYLKAIEDPNVTRMLQTWTPTQAYRELGIVKDPTDRLPFVEPPPLPEGQFYTFEADPPWSLDANEGKSGGAQYQVMDTEKIKGITSYKKMIKQPCYRRSEKVAIPQIGE